MQPPTMKAAQAWQAALSQLQQEMPKGAFDTWVREARLIRHEDGKFIIGVANGYARDWLAERLTKTLENLLAGILDQPLKVQFVVQEEPLDANPGELVPEQAWAETQRILERVTYPTDYAAWIAPIRYQSCAAGCLTLAAPSPAALNWLNEHLKDRAQNLLSGLLGQPVAIVFAGPTGDDPPSAADWARQEEAEQSAERDRPMLLEVAREDLRAAYTRPDQVHVMPAYLLRWLPYASPGQFLTLIAFRQAMYCARNGAPTENVPFSASIRSIASIIGANKDTVLAHRDSWLLRWFLRHLPNDQYTFHPETGQVRRQADRYTFLATTPLTPGDQDALQNWLLENGIRADPIVALKRALAQPPREILPYPAPKPSALLKQRPPSDKNRSFNSLVLALCPPELPEETLAEVLDLAGQLRERLISADKLAFVSLYFLRHWGPLLGNGAACAAIACRQRAYDNQATGEVREVFKLAGGLATLAALTGLGVSTLRKLLPLPEQGGKSGRAGRKHGVSPGGGSPDTRRATRRKERRQLLSRIIHRTRKSGRDDLLLWTRKADPLIPDHQADYEAANSWIAWFLSRFPAGFEEAHIDAFLRALIEGGVLQSGQPLTDSENGFISENPDDEFGDFRDNGVGEKPDNEISVFSPEGISEKLDKVFSGISDNSISDDSTKGLARNWAESGQLKYKRIQYLEPKTLKNILIPLSNTSPTTSTRQESPESWPVQVGEGWQDVLSPHTLGSFSRNHPKIDAPDIDWEATVTHWLHVYSPDGEGIRLPHEYVRSRLDSGAYSPTHLRLARLGPKALSDLIRDTEIEDLTGRLLVASELPGAKEWRQLMQGTKNQDRLLELAERLGLLVQGQPKRQREKIVDPQG